VITYEQKFFNNGYFASSGYFYCFTVISGLMHLKFAAHVS
jgi:hypothetical protein